MAHDIIKREISAPEEAGLSTSRLERINSAMRAYVDQQKIAGLSTMIARKGKVVHFEQIGQMDIEANKSMSENAIFRIYSMTKPIICTAFMILYEQGCFKLSDPVAKFIPAFDKLKVLESDVAGETKEVSLDRPITIHDLLTHTAGLTYDFFEDSPVSEMYRQARLNTNPQRTLEEMIEELVRLPLAYQPGSKWHYSLASDVVAYLIEVISDQSLAHFLQENLFTPLDMTDTGFHVPSEKRSRLATMYASDKVAPEMTLSQWVEAWASGSYEPIDVSETYPASNTSSFARGGTGLFSTAWDYMHFSRMLLNQGELNGTRILGRKIVDFMHFNHLPSNLLPYEMGGFPVKGYGWGLDSTVLMNVAESEMPGSIGQFGWNGAAKTHFWVDPQEELIGLIMAQSFMQFDTLEKDFQILTYQALVD